MKTLLTKSLPITLMLAASSVVFAADYSTMSTSELGAMRDQTRYMDDSERDAYRSEMQGRMQSMSADERDSYRSSNQGSGGGNGSGNGNGRSAADRDAHRSKMQSMSTEERDAYRSERSSSGSYGQGYGNRGGGGQR